MQSVDVIIGMNSGTWGSHRAFQERILHVERKQRLAQERKAVCADQIRSADRSPPNFKRRSFVPELARKAASFLCFGSTGIRDSQHGKTPPTPTRGHDRYGTEFSPHIIQIQIQIPSFPGSRTTRTVRAQGASLRVTPRKSSTVA